MIKPSWKHSVAFAGSPAAESPPRSDTIIIDPVKERQLSVIKDRFEHHYVGRMDTTPKMVVEDKRIAVVHFLERPIL